MDTLRISLLVVGILIITGIYFLTRRQLDSDERSIKMTPTIPWSKLFSKLNTQIRKIFVTLFASSRSLLSRLSWPAFKPVRVGQSDWEHTTSGESPPTHDAVENQGELTDEDLDGIEPIVADRKQIVSSAEDVTLIVELTSDQIAPGGEQLFIPVTIIDRHGRSFTGEKIMFATEECGFVLDDSGIFYYEAKDQQGYEQRLLGLANIVEPGTFEEEHMRTFETPGLVLYLHLPAPIEAREAFSSLIEKGRKLAEALEGQLCDETRSVLTNQTIGHLKEKVEAFRFKQKMTQLKHHHKP